MWSTKGQSLVGVKYYSWPLVGGQYMHFVSEILCALFSGNIMELLFLLGGSK